MLQDQRSFLKSASVGLSPRTLCVFAALAIGGCATSPALEGVQIAATADQVAQCRFLGRVLGNYALVTGLRPGAMRDDAIRQISVRARRLDGNIVLLDPNSTAGAGTTMAADVFRC